MKKILCLLTTTLFLTACSEKNEFEAAVLEEMQKEQDVKDYHIDPETMAKCVIDMTKEKMPGFYDLDPYRRKAYQNYTKMLRLAKSDDTKKTLEELRQDFGTPKDLADAHSNFTESMMHCYSAVMARDEPAEEASAAGAESSAPAAAGVGESAAEPAQTAPVEESAK